MTPKEFVADMASRMDRLYPGWEERFHIAQMTFVPADDTQEAIRNAEEMKQYWLNEQATRLQAKIQHQWNELQAVPAYVERDLSKDEGVQSW